MRFSCRQVYDYSSQPAFVNFVNTAADVSDDADLVRVISENLRPDLAARRILQVCSEDCSHAYNLIDRAGKSQLLPDIYGDRDSLTNYFNSAAFALPATGTCGNIGAYTAVGPGFWDWSQAVSRQFRIRESQTIEIRAEAFNVTNSFRPGNPSTILSSPNTFWKILCSASGTTGEGTLGTGCVQPGQTGVNPSGGPRILQFAVKYVF